MSQATREATTILINDYFRHLGYLKRSPLTLKVYKVDINNFTDYLISKNLNLTMLKKGDSVFYVKFMSQRNLHPNTIHRAVSSLRGLYRYLVDQNAVKSNPFNGLLLPKAPQRLPKTVTRSQMMDVFSVLEQDNSYEGVRNLALIELLYCGSRSGPVRDLKFKNLDMEKRAIKVIGKGDVEQVYPFTVKAATAIEKWTKIRVTSPLSKGHVFTDKRGKALHPTKFIKIIHDIFEPVQAGVSPHWLRHSFATHMLDAGVDITQVSKLLHHKNLDTTMIYIDIGEDKLKNVIDANHPRG